MEEQYGHNLKYSKHLDDPMTLKELEIWHSQEIEISQSLARGRTGQPGKTYKETMKELAVSSGAIVRTKRKADYNALTRAQFDKVKAGIEYYVDGIVAATKATKQVTVRVPSKVKGNVGSAAMLRKTIDVPENVTRFNAFCKIGDCFGVDAPKQVDLKHSMAAMSDDELIEQVNKSAEEIENNGSIQRQIAGAQNAGSNITTQVACHKPGVAVGAGKQAVCPADT